MAVFLAPALPALTSWLGTTMAGKAVVGTALAGAASYGIANAMKEDEAQKQAKQARQEKEDTEAYNAVLNSPEFNAFAQAQAQKNPTQESKADFSGLLLDDATQKQANKEASTQLLAQEHSPDTQATHEAIHQKPMRNTGISYFDNKEHLSIADAYLAKLLGVNVSYTYMDANINADMRQKKTNMNQALNTMHGNNAAVLSFTQGVPEYVENDLGSTTNALSRAFNRWSGGFFSWSSDANKKEQGYNEYRSRAVARIISDNPRGVTQKDMENARGLVSTNWKDSTGFMADTQNFLEMALIKQREELNKIDNLGLRVPEEERYKLLAIENMQKALSGGTMNETQFKANRQALQILHEYKNDPKKTNEALALILAQ